MKNLAKILIITLLLMSVLVFIGCDYGTECQYNPDDINSHNNDENEMPYDYVMAPISAVVIENDVRLMVQLRDGGRIFERDGDEGIDRFFIRGDSMFFEPENPADEPVPATIEDLTVGTYVRVYATNRWRLSHPPGNSPYKVIIERD